MQMTRSSLDSISRFCKVEVMSIADEVLVADEIHVSTTGRMRHSAKWFRRSVRRVSGNSLS